VSRRPDDCRRSRPDGYNGTKPFVAIQVRQRPPSGRQASPWPTERPHVFEPLTGPDDEDLLATVIDDIRRNASEQQTTDRTPSVAADDDDVRALRLGDLDQGCSGIALPDQGLSRDAAPTRSCHHRHQGRFALTSHLVDARMEQSTWQPEASRVDHAHEDQGRADLSGQIDACALGAGGRRARVGCDEDASGCRPALLAPGAGDPSNGLIRRTKRRLSEPLVCVHVRRVARESVQREGPVRPLRGAGGPEHDRRCQARPMSPDGWSEAPVEASLDARAQNPSAPVISDDGVGYDPSRPVAAGHHGLGNMRTRAEANGATRSVESTKGQGTRIIVSLPDRTDV